MYSLLPWPTNRKVGNIHQLQAKDEINVPIALSAFRDKNQLHMYIYETTFSDWGENVLPFPLSSHDIVTMK